MLSVMYLAIDYNPVGFKWISYSIYKTKVG